MLVNILILQPKLCILLEIVVLLKIVVPFLVFYQCVLSFLSMSDILFFQSKCSLAEIILPS